MTGICNVFNRQLTLNTFASVMFLWWITITLPSSLYIARTLSSQKGAHRRPPPLSETSSVRSPAEVRKKPELVIAATVKNVAPHLNKLKARILEVTSSFELVQFVFFENDSSDDTVDQLELWNHVAPVHMISTHLQSERTVALAWGRSSVWLTIEQLSIDPDAFVLWLDFDDVNYGLANLDSCMDLPPSWSVCCANQYYLYYDLWALRESSWMPCDWWNTCTEEFRATETQRAKHIPADHPPIQVDSCFGGAALYKYSHLKGLDLEKYDGMSQRLEPSNDPSHPPRMVPHEGCEHVPFHFSLKEQNPNFTMFVQPTFLNSGPALDLHKPFVVDAARPLWKESFSKPELARLYSHRES